MKNNFSKKVAAFLIIVSIVVYILYVFLFSNTLMQYLFHEKIWVHRVNSIEKLKEVENKFYGVELDVVYNDSLNIFDVTHPPEPSINLNLLTYLKSCKTKDLHFWLDFKNLTHNNAFNAYERLNSICEKLNIEKKKFIIESQNPQPLEKYVENGFETSYYLPWPGLHQLKNDTLNRTIKSINKNLTTDLSYISSNYHDYPIMKENFPKKNKLFWLTGLEKESSSSLRERIFLYKIF